jgi:hypothetical protein
VGGAPAAGPPARPPPPPPPNIGATCTPSSFILQYAAAAAQRGLRSWNERSVELGVKKEEEEEKICFEANYMGCAFGMCFWFEKKKKNGMCFFFKKK